MNYTPRIEDRLSTGRDIITISDYGTCPTIKSNNAINTIIVVKSDARFQPVEARTNNFNNGHYESLENRTLGSLPQ
jgi:hypothetical protein